MSDKTDYGLHLLRLLVIFFFGFYIARFVDIQFVFLDYIVKIQALDHVLHIFDCNNSVRTYGPCAIRRRASCHSGRGSVGIELIRLFFLFVDMVDLHTISAQD